MPEVVIIGQIIGSSGFQDTSALSCRWELVADADFWTVVRGETSGKTHVTEDVEDDLCVWCHPLETHYSTSSIQGWPQLSVQVWQYDNIDRGSIAGYGCCRVPTAPGVHEVDVVTWAPESGGLMERFAAKILGCHPQLEHPDLVTDPEVDRCELKTASKGLVHIELQVLVKGFDKKGVRLNDAPSGEVGKRARDAKC